MAQPLRFQHLTTDDGLSDNAITCIHQDRSGVIWAGTEHGLNRFDGSLVQRVDVEGDAGPGGEWITGLAEDAAGVLWITTHDHGLIRYQPTTGSSRRFRGTGDGRGIASDQLNGVFDLNDTTLLIAAREVSLIFMDKRTCTFSYWTDTTTLDPARARPTATGMRGWCHTVVPLNERLLWVGFLNNRFSMLIDRATLRNMGSLVVQRAGSESQTCALLHDGTLLTGGWQSGVDVIDMTSIERPPGISRPAPRVIDIPDEVCAMVHWGSSGVLTATRQNGLIMIDPSKGEQVRSMHQRNDPASLASDRVRALLVDRSGILWVGTANGLDRHDPRVWRMDVLDLFDDEADHPDLFFHRIDALAEGGARIYTSDGFFTTDAEGRVTHRVVRANGMDLQPTVIGYDHHGHVLLGTEYGIQRYDDLSKAPTGVIEPHSKDGFTYHVGRMFQVRGIWPDTLDGRAVYVIGTVGFGVPVVDAGSLELIGMVMPGSATTVNSHSLVNDIARDGNGRYWCASAGGLYSWRSGEPMVEEDNIARPDTANIIAPGEDVRRLILHRDTVWAVTRSGVLLRVVHGHSNVITPPEELRRSMHGITMDRMGMLWMTTDDGLLRYSPADGGFIHVPINDGRMFRKLTRAIATLADGRIALCADNSLLTFDPRTFLALPSLPRPYLTSVSAAGKAVEVGNGEVRLSYRAGVIDIGLSAMASGFPMALRFEYRLQDVEPEWRTTGARDEVRYAGIPVGRHVLLVRVHDAYGRTGPPVELLTIEVTGPFWQRWWFYAVVAVVFSTAAFAWSRYRLKQALKLQAVRNRIASDLHDEVGSSLSSITIGSQLASKLGAGENEKVQRIMERIGETSSQSLRSMSDIVWAIDPKNDEGEALVKRMQRIAGELLTVKGIDVSFSIGTGVEDLRLPMEARKELVLLFKEAVHNASKYSGASTVQVSVHRRGGKLTLSIKDDGAGFDPVLHPDGHGLGSMHRRAAALGAHLQLVSAPGLGTLVGVEVDLSRVAR